MNVPILRIIYLIILLLTFFPGGILFGNTWCDMPCRHIIYFSYLSTILFLIFGIIFANTLFIKGEAKVKKFLAIFPFIVIPLILSILPESKNINTAFVNSCKKNIHMFKIDNNLFNTTMYVVKKNSVYYNDDHSCHKIKQADITTFKLLGPKMAIDKKHLYVGKKTLKKGDMDLATIKALFPKNGMSISNSYFKDKTGIYCYDHYNEIVKIPQADLTTFRVTERTTKTSNNGYCYSEAEDKNHRYEYCRIAQCDK